MIHGIQFPVSTGIVLQSFPTSDACSRILSKVPSSAPLQKQRLEKLCSLLLSREVVHKVSNKLGPLDYGSFMPLMF